MTCGRTRPYRDWLCSALTVSPNLRGINQSLFIEYTFPGSSPRPAITDARISFPVGELFRAFSSYLHSNRSACLVLSLATITNIYNFKQNLVHHSRIEPIGRLFVALLFLFFSFLFIFFSYLLAEWASVVSVSRLSKVWLIDGFAAKL